MKAAPPLIWAATTGAVASTRVVRVSLGGPFVLAVSHTPGATHSRSSATTRIAYSRASRRVSVVLEDDAGTTNEARPGIVTSCTVTRYCRPTLPGVNAAGSQLTSTWGPFEKAGSAWIETCPGAAVAPAGRATAVATVSPSHRRRGVIPR